MSYLRLIKSKGVVTTVFLILLTIFIVSKYDANSHRVKKLKESSQLQQTTFTKKQHPNTLSTGFFSRLDAPHQQILTSALAHIRLGYVANRTPDYSTPPLLILYSCHSSSCGPLSHRLINMANSYFFSMLQQGSAFAYDMTFPVRFEWFFEPLPVYMSMNTDQAQFYAEKANVVHEEPLLTQQDIATRPFLETYQQNKITIVNVTEWQGNWVDLGRNPSMKALRDKYRLNHLRQPSDWFWIVSQLLFSQPAPELRRLLEPYRDIMGGTLDASTSLSPFDPASSKVTEEFRSWLRVGLRVNDAEKKEIKCMTRYVTDVCKKNLGFYEQLKTCHVFVSASNRELFEKVKKELNSKKIVIHALDDAFEYGDLDQDEGNKERYARLFMEWIILSRMDYLVGQVNDEYLKTAAWSAQVQTDLSYHGDQQDCRMMSMTDW